MSVNEADVDEFAKIVWDYLQLKQEVKKCDAIFALGVLDTRVAERAVQLYKDGYGGFLIFSGGAGALTKNRLDKSEAEVFAEIAIQKGVPQEKIIVEKKSANTGQNIQFTCELLKEKGLSPKSLLIVQKPYMERRTYVTFKKQWPDSETEIIVTSPQIKYEDYFNDVIPRDLVLNVMVGDLQRIKEYPKQGFQIEQDIPKHVWNAYERLVKLGYNKFLIK